MANEFTISADFDTSASNLWKAWTDEELFCSWIVPDDTHINRESVRFDVQQGGELRYTMVNPSTDEEFPTGGQYLRVEQPDVLSFTWGDIADENERALITLNFAPLNEVQTRLDFTLVGFEGELGDSGIYDGWFEALENLKRNIAGPGKSAEPRDF